MDILLFLFLTIFFIYRLKNNFGLRDEDDEKRRKAIEDFIKQKNKADSNIIDANDVIYNKNSANQNNNKKFELKSNISDLVKLQLAKINFNEQNFLTGAELAVEMINEAFSNKDLNTLREILSNDVYNNFKTKIDSLTEQNKFLKSSLISIKEKSIKAIEVVDNMIKISVCFRMEQINFIEDKNGNVVFGDKKKIEPVNELWVFERSINSTKNFWIVTNISDIQ